jgi:site-specific recombinase XerD
MPLDVKEAIRKECSRRRLSPRTIHTYQQCVERFLRKTNKPIGKLSKKDVRLFLEGLDKKGRAGKTLNVYHMAIKLFMEDILNKRMWLNIKYSKAPKKLPVFLTREEVKKLIDSMKNEKHRLMIKLIYSSGIRVSELANLKVGDLELDKNYGFVRGGKGNKDRLFIIAKNIKRGILSHIEEGNLKKSDFLFVSLRKKKYDTGTIRLIIKDAAKKAGITKNVSPHVLRHSFATHLIEDGYSVADVQLLLGHKSPETTFIYLHAASPNLIKIESPLDTL